MLVEISTVPSVVLPIWQFRDHLRLGTGFADQGAEDGLMEAYLRAALSAIEARIGKALIARDFAWTLTRWRDPATQPLPLAPVGTIAQVVMIDANGTQTAVAPNRYRLVRDTHVPVLAARGACLPPVPWDGSVRIEFTAGFGAHWNDLPHDLGQAVMLLAAHYFEHRLGATPSEMTPEIFALIERWRALRSLGRGA